jgi:hypothetical protein
MTASELKTGFLIYYDKITNGEAPGYEDNEISQFLIDAEESIVDEAINSKRIDLLGHITKVQYATMGSGTLPYEARISLDTGFTDLWKFYSLNVYLKRSFPIAESKWYPTEQILKSEIGNYLTTSFNKPVLEIPKYWFEEYSGIGRVIMVQLDSYSLHYDGINPNQSEITYIRKPVAINITNNISSELDTSLHLRLTQIAANKAIKTADPERAAALNLQ